MNYHLDLESRSKVDLGDCGAYRYAEDPSTEILMFAIATDDEGPFLWVHPKWRHIQASDPRADELLNRALTEEDALIYAHNAQFERAMLIYRALLDLGLVRIPRQDQWRCTSAMGRKAALHGDLAGLAKDLEMPIGKDTEGEKLKKIFCWPAKGETEFIDPSERPDDFRRFCQYNITDVVVERSIHHKLKPFELTGLSLSTFLLDVRLNDRGIPVNVKAAENARRIVDEMLSDKVLEFNALTGLNPTQRQKVKELLEEHGLPMADMKQPTLEAALLLVEKKFSLDAEKWGFVYDVLKGYAELNFAAAKKVHVILQCVNTDGRVRGTLLYHGAGTGRWAGRLIQPQNFKKPAKHHAKVTGLIYQMICDGCTREQLEMIFGNPMDAIASCVRHFIQCGLDADYASIEARIVCWLAGQLDALEDFRKGVDQYKKLAAVIFNKTIEQIENPSFEREVGKRGILGCGFQMSGGKFVKSCAQYGVTITRELADKAVAAYRQEFDRVRQLWYDADKAARNAISNPGKSYTAGPKLSFTVRRISDIPFLCMKLPSNRVIVYPHPKIEQMPESKQRQMHGDSKKKFVFDPDKTQITFYGNIKGNLWGRCSIYGGMFIENATQGTAADIMSPGAQNAEKAGFEILTLIHDQALAHRRPGRSDKQDAEDFRSALRSLPEWAIGCPIDAESKCVEYYRK